MKILKRAALLSVISSVIAVFPSVSNAQITSLTELTAPFGQANAGEISLEERAKHCLTIGPGALSFRGVEAPLVKGAAKQKVSEWYEANLFEVRGTEYASGPDYNSEHIIYCNANIIGSTLTIRKSSARFVNGGGLAHTPFVKIWKYNAKNQ